MMKIRGSTGRLMAGERRRRINAASPKPGEVVILDQSRRASKGERSRGAMQVELRVETQFSVDLDVRKLVDRIRVDLASSFTDDLLAHQKADGKGQLPVLSEKTLALEKSKGRTRSKDSFGERSGWMAQHWLLLPMRGGPYQASCVIKPNGSQGRSFMINSQLQRGIDFQSVTGSKAELIKEITAEWLRGAVPSSGDGVATPASADTRCGDHSQR
jgi:hypothetical protein